MKVTVRSEADHLTIYIAKKDLELKVVETDPNHAFGGLWKIENGMVLEVPPQSEVPRLPLTLNARKVSE